MSKSDRPSFGEKALPLMPTKTRTEKRRASLSTDKEYIIRVTNPSRRPTPTLVADNNYPTPEGDDILSFIESFGFEAEIEEDQEDWRE